VQDEGHRSIVARLLRQARLNIQRLPIKIQMGTNMSARYPPPCVMGTEAIMVSTIEYFFYKLSSLTNETHRFQSRKSHGTSETPVMKNLRWNCDWETADRICNFNRHYAEYSGYYEKTDFVKYAKSLPEGETIPFYDSNTGKLLFTAPVGRSMDEFLQESRAHGWPSYVNS
jgi:hypothetical protein